MLPGDVIPRLLVGAMLLPPLRLPRVFYTGLVPLVNRVMRIGVAEFFQDEFVAVGDDDDDDECIWAVHGTIEGQSGRPKQYWLGPRNQYWLGLILEPRQPTHITFFFFVFWCVRN